MPNYAYADITDIAESIFDARLKHARKTGVSQPKMITYLGIDQHRSLQEYCHQTGSVRDDSLIGKEEMFRGSIIVPVMLSSHLATYVVEE